MYTNTSNSAESIINSQNRLLPLITAVQCTTTKTPNIRTAFQTECIFRSNCFEKTSRLRTTLFFHRDFAFNLLTTLMYPIRNIIQVNAAIFPIHMNAPIPTSCSEPSYVVPKPDIWLDAG